MHEQGGGPCSALPMHPKAGVVRPPANPGSRVPGGQRFDARHPAPTASDSEQNQRSPLERLIWVWL
jgi:hypothetical protein